MNLRAEVVVGTEEVDNLLPEVVDIDRYLVESCFLQPQYHPFQHGLSCYGNEGLGHVVRQGAQPGAQAGGENHGFHIGIFSH